MFCKICGKELSDNAKFCNACGAETMPTPAENVCAEQSIPAPVLEQPLQTAPEVVAPRKAVPPVAIIIGAVAAVAVLVLTLLLTGVFDSDSTRVFKALEKSGKAFEHAAEALDLPDLKYIQADKAYSVDFGFQINEVYGAEEISDLGLTGSADFSLSDKKMGMTLTPSYGSVELLNMQMKLDNNMLYLNIPEITGETGYSMNTETVFQDVSRFTEVPEELADVRINVMELMRIMDEKMMYTKEDQKKVDEAIVALLKSIEAEKTDSGEITVNGNDMKCDKYHVVVPEHSLRDYFSVLANIMAEKNVAQAMREAYIAMNIPTEEMDFSDLEMGTDEIMDELDDMLNELGDIELEVYLKGGYVMAVIFETDMDGERVEFVLNIGGGENYVDDLSLTVSDDYTTIVMESSGNHAAKGGAFTDETVMYVKEDGEKYVVLDSSLSFDTKSKAENFEWTLDMEESADMALDICGSVTFTGSSMTVDLTDICISEYGQELVDLSVYYQVDPYSDNIQIPGTVELLKLSEDEILEEIEALSARVETWAMGLLDKIPELQYLLY